MSGEMTEDMDAKAQLVQVETNISKDGLTACFAYEENKRNGAPSNQVRSMMKLSGQGIRTFSLVVWALKCVVHGVANRKFY